MATGIAEKIILPSGVFLEGVLIKGNCPGPWWSPIPILCTAETCIIMWLV